MSLNQGRNSATPTRKFTHDVHENSYRTLIRQGTPPGLAQSMVLQSSEGATLFTNTQLPQQPEVGRGMGNTSSLNRAPPRGGMENNSSSSHPRRQETGGPSSSARPPVQEEVGSSSSISRPPPQETGGPSRFSANQFTETFRRNLYDEYVGQGNPRDIVEQVIRDRWPGNGPVDRYAPPPGHINAPANPLTNSPTNRPVNPNTPAPPAGQVTPLGGPPSSNPPRNPFVNPELRELYDRRVAQGINPSHVVRTVLDNWPAHIPREDLGGYVPPMVNEPYSEDVWRDLIVQLIDGGYSHADAIRHVRRLMAENGGGA